MYGEDLELENVERIERLLVDKHGTLSVSLTNNINTIKTNLRLYLIDDGLLNRINEEMYKASQLDDIKEVESIIRQLTQTFWD